MILRKICTEPLSIWEECFVATYFLKGLDLSGYALDEERKERIASSLDLLRSLPIEAARELCIEVLRHAQDQDLKFK